jgi:hypothetical protein
MHASLSPFLLVVKLVGGDKIVKVMMRAIMKFLPGKMAEGKKLVDEMIAYTSLDYLAFNNKMGRKND